MLTLNIFVNNVFKHNTMLANSKYNDELTNAILLPKLPIYQYTATT